MSIGENKLKKVLIVIGILLVIAVILAVPRFRQRQNPTSEQAEAVVLKPVEITKATRGEIRLEHQLSGTIQAASQVSVYPKIAGRLITLNIDEGDRVEKDAPLGHC